MIVTKDDKYLVTASEDGSLLIWSIDERLKEETCSADLEVVINVPTQ